MLRWFRTLARAGTFPLRWVELSLLTALCAHKRCRADVSLFMPEGATSAVEAICRTIRVADDAVIACHVQLPPAHPARAAMDDVVVRLHDARRAAELVA